MKNLKLVLLFTVLVLATTSCTKQQTNEPALSNDEEQVDLNAYEDLFRSIDAESSSNFGSNVELLPYSENYQSLREAGRLWRWIKRHSKAIITVASDALGGVVGSFGGPGCTVGGAVLASGVVGAALGGEVKGTADKGGNTITITLSTSSTLEAKNGDILTIGEAHNRTLHKASLKDMFSSNKSADDVYAQLRKEVAEDYKIKLSSIPEKNPVSFTPSELLNCIESPEVNSFDEMVLQMSEISNVSKARVRYILTTVINNLMLVENNGNVETYNIDLSKIISQSSLTKEEQQLLIDGTSIAANSNLYWNENN